MTPTDLSELGLELLIAGELTGHAPADLRAAQSGGIREVPAGYGGAGWTLGDPRDFDREHALDTRQLFVFLDRTQPEAVTETNIGQSGPSRTAFLNRLQGEIAKRGVVDVLRRGVKHGPDAFDLYSPLPTPGNPTAARNCAANVFSVTRQLRYSADETQRALDLALFVNGLPVATLELKNSLTAQTVTDAIAQYKRDRSPKERLFALGVCAVHFAVDDSEVWFTTELKGDQTIFLPFNKGFNDGGGNPPNPAGIKTDYLWKEVLRRDSLAGLIENFLQVVTEKGENGRKTRRAIFPRYHQLDVVRKLLADAEQSGVGRRYLIQHSAGSGKSNSIAWLAHQLIELSAGPKPLFETVIIVTDRTALDRQLSGTVRQMTRDGWTTKRAETSGDLAELIRKGQRIVLTTIQKFPYIARSIGAEHRGRTFAIIIDEAHSSQGGRAAGQLNAALARRPELARELEIAPGEEIEEVSSQDELILQMSGRKMLSNASYFAFTATPKQKTLELFGERCERHCSVTFRPFHVYTMKQAIDEGFILDVLRNYTPYRSYYRLMKTVADDPEYDRKRAQKKLRLFVESHDVPIRQKAALIVDHFHTHVIQPGKVGGQARAMVITSSIDRAIAYWQAIRAELREHNSPYRAIVAFTGEREVEGRMQTESHLNGFPSSQIPDRFKEHPYRLLVVADKYQTGFDEPLLHTMYVDKMLSSVKAVQTLSRLNRAHPAKTDTFILDFFNDPDDVVRAFQPFFRTTLLSGETDPDKLHDLKDALDQAGVYTWPEVETFVRDYLAGANRAKLDPLLDLCRVRYESEALDDEGRIAFKGDAKAFVRAYGFLSAILPYDNAEWEQLSIFLRFLIPKLPAPDDPDLAKDILQAIDMESYRVEAQQTVDLTLRDEVGAIDPAIATNGGPPPAPELDHLSVILQQFNDLFADAGFTDADRVTTMRNIEGPIMDALVENELLAATFRHSDAQNTLVSFTDAFQKALIANIHNNTQVYAHQQKSDSFRQQLEAMVYALYQQRMSGTS